MVTRDRASPRRRAEKGRTQQPQQLDSRTETLQKREIDVCMARKKKIDTRMQEIVIAYKGRRSMGVRQRQLAPACGKRRTSAARGQLSHMPSAPRTESRPVRRSNNRKSARASKRDGPTACRLVPPPCSHTAPCNAPSTPSPPHSTPRSRVHPSRPPRT